MMSILRQWLISFIITEGFEDIAEEIIDIIQEILKHLLTQPG
jgi:hypothetical protein